MSMLNSRPILRWLVPAGVTLAVIGGGAAIGAITAAADPTLPPRSAADLLVDLQTARLDALSGTVVTRADLGLPALPELGGGAAGGGAASLTGLLSGTHTVRVWYSGPDKARVALLGTLGETDLITNGTDVWTWDSRANKATHTTVPKDSKDTTDTKGSPPVPHPSGSLAGMTPRQVADLALAAINPSTEVTTQGTARIAGRDAYELVLSPRDPGSLIGSLRLAVDASAHVPLRAQIFARGATDPAFEVAFTQVSFARPDDAQFRFNPPPGTTVTEADANAKTGAGSGQPGPGADLLGRTPGAPGSTKPQFTVIGSGWTSVLVARAPAGTSGPDKSGRPGGTTGSGGKSGPDGAGIAGLLSGLPSVSGAWGSGHLFSTKLLTVLVTDDGRIFVGAVSPNRIYQAAADPAAKLGS
jgi:outer membrane lipoprotein-sorting protein